MSDTEMGGTYRDKVSGFVGILIARAEYLYSNNEVLLCAETKQAASDSRWIPEERVERVGARGTGFAG